MIVEYHRPKSLDEALQLLSRAQPVTHPLGGGTVLNRPGGEPIAVVDLQGLSLNAIIPQGNTLSIGAAVPLQVLVEANAVPDAVRKAARLEASLNLRNVGTVAGTLVSAGGRSPLTTLLLAMDAKLVWLPDGEEISLGDWLPLRGERKPGLLITEVRIPLQVRAVFESVGRTPADWPIVCAGMARWSSNRTRLALGGYGQSPLMVVDGNDGEGLEVAARDAARDAAQDAYSQAGDEWASAEYRQEVAGILAMRCLEGVNAI